MTEPERPLLRSAVRYLPRAGQVTGEIIHVDGGSQLLISTGDPLENGFKRLALNNVILGYRAPEVVVLLPTQETSASARTHQVGI